MADDAEKTIQGGLTEAEKRANVIRLAFDGSEEKFADFVRIVREEIPEGTAVVLRGSAVTGATWNPRSTNQCAVRVVSTNSRRIFFCLARACTASSRRSPAPCLR